MREPPDGSFHSLGESICREFVLPVFCVQMFLNFADKMIAFAPYRCIRKVVIHDQEADVLGHVPQI